MSTLLLLGAAQKLLLRYGKGIFMKNDKAENYKPNHSHAWRGSWDRPMLIDEDSLHPFTVARMTDHNVRGVDKRVTGESQVNIDAERHPEEQLPPESVVH